MGRHDTSGLVLEVSPFRDSSEIITLFAEEAGPIGLVSLGAKKPGKSAHAKAGAAVFASVRAGFNRRSEDAMGTLVELSATAPRLALREDLDTYAVGQLALELLRATPRHTPGTPTLLSLGEGFLDALDAEAAAIAGQPTIDRVAGRPELRLRITARLGRFLVDYLNESGHAPMWQRCAVTHEPFAADAGSAPSAGTRSLHFSGDYFSVSLGGRVSAAGLDVLRERRRLNAEGCRPVSPITVRLLDAWMAGEHLGDPRLTLADYERPLNLLIVFARHHLAAPLDAYRYLRQRFFSAASKQRQAANLAGAMAGAADAPQSEVSPTHDHANAEHHDDAPDAYDDDAPVQP